MDAHYEALESLAKQGALSSRVYDTVRVDADGLVRGQYLILYRNVPDDITSGRYTAVADMDSELTYEWDVRAVGTTAKAAGDTMNLFLRNTIGVRLSVEGRSCTPLNIGVSGGRVVPDTSVKPHLYYVDASVVCVSRPA